MTANKRVAKELEDLQKKLPRYLRNLFSDDANVLVWHALLLPPSAKSGQRSQHLDSALTSYIIQTPLSCPLCNEGSEGIWSSGTSLRVPVLCAGVSQVPRFLPTRAGKYCSCVLCTDILALSLWPWETPPYNLKAFHLRICFPEEYPFKPPTVTFTTRIYHPNVDSNGRVCLPIISNEYWKPYTKTCQVLEALNVLVNKPEPEQPVRLELADLLAQDPELFNRKAEEFTLQFGEDRHS
ncbi:ubiquitin/ISG15-conjugating enzyme E2 L6 isoform X1 [Camelus ferus]|uniref:E2 ubiquitin-conjugating enzyme n=1 Tax=Camelus ferus TaxID=419612 RepID=A0A8B7K5X3_CAMFR|nr:ubiquitin/ISG15-conjugating enzyme E2 L6 isoform X1 [Camelus ferus]